MKGRLYSSVPIVTILFLAFLAGFSLLHSGLPPTHDGEYHVIRFYEFDKIFRSGVLYPRWAPDLNYGYGVPLFNYVYPLPNYVASLLHLSGISFIDAFKLQMFSASIVGGIFFYLWTKHFWGEIGGVVSAIFYLYSPYRFVDIYIRGSVGEVWALAFFPAFFWSINNFFYKKNKTSILYSSLFLAAIIFSHNILALMFLFFTVFYIAFLICQSKDKIYFTLNASFIILLGIGLSSIFWLPALLEKQYVVGLQIYDIGENFPQIFQLLFPSWGSGFATSDLQNQMSYQIGVGNLFAIILATVAGLIMFRKRDMHRFFVAYFLVWFIFVFFLMLNLSLPIWRHIPLMNYFQFPWRLLSLEIIIASFLAGSIFRVIQSKVLAFGMILGVFLLTIGYTRPAYYHQRDDNYYITRSNFIDGTNSAGNVFNTIWIHKVLKREKEKIKIIKGSGVITDQYIDPVRHRFKAETKTRSEIEISTAYFPGWKAFVNGKETNIINKEGIISFFLPPGIYFVEVQFLDTITRLIGAYLSIISIAGFVVLCTRIISLRQ